MHERQWSFLEFGGVAEDLQSTVVVNVHLAVHETVLGLTQGEVLVISTEKGKRGRKRKR